MTYQPIENYGIIGDLHMAERATLPPLTSGDTLHWPEPLCPSVQADDRADTAPVHDLVPDGAYEALAACHHHNQSGARSSPSLCAPTRVVMVIVWDSSWWNIQTGGTLCPMQEADRDAATWRFWRFERTAGARRL